MTLHAPSGRYPLKWEFELDVNRSWIDSFVNSFRSVDFVVITDHRDDFPTGYTWSSPHLNELDDLAEVMRRAASLKALFDGAMLVHRRGEYDPRRVSRPVGAGHSWQEPDTSFPSEPFSIGRDGWPYHEIDNPLLHQVSSWLFLARYNDVAKHMLIFLGVQGVSWISLYALTDFMNHSKWDDKKIAAAAGVTNGEMKRFSHTANSYPATGPFGRHGATGAQPPTNPMTLKEATAIVLKATNAFLNDLASKEQLGTKFQLLARPEPL